MDPLAFLRLPLDGDKEMLRSDLERLNPPLYRLSTKNSAILSQRPIWLADFIKYAHSCAKFNPDTFTQTAPYQAYVDFMTQAGYYVSEHTYKLLLISEIRRQITDENEDEMHFALKRLEETFGGHTAFLFMEMLLYENGHTAPHHTSAMWRVILKISKKHFPVVTLSCAQRCIYHLSRWESDAETRRELALWLMGSTERYGPIVDDVLSSL